MFLLLQNDENQSENGSKNSKIRLRARPPAEPQKKMLQTKKLRSKSWKNTVFFHFLLADFGRARSRTGVFPYCFLQCFLKASVTTYQKQEVLAEKCPSPPGKPVTFYECHPEDHACGRISLGFFSSSFFLSFFRASFIVFVVFLPWGFWHLREGLCCYCSVVCCFHGAGWLWLLSHLRRCTYATELR